MSSCVIYYTILLSDERRDLSFGLGHEAGRALLGGVEEQEGAPPRGAPVPSPPAPRRRHATDPLPCPPGDGLPLGDADACVGEGEELSCPQWSSPAAAARSSLTSAPASVSSSLFTTPTSRCSTRWSLSEALVLGGAAAVVIVVIVIVVIPLLCCYCRCRSCWAAAATASEAECSAPASHLTAAAGP